MGKPPNAPDSVQACVCAHSCQALYVNLSIAPPHGCIPLMFTAESVVVGPHGQLVMLDRYNQLWEAKQDQGSGAWALSPKPLAQLGPGRPLGYHFDHDGNLIVCDSLKVNFDAHEEAFEAATGRAEQFC